MAKLLSEIIDEIVPRHVIDNPAYWLSILDEALETGLHEAAIAARRHLRRLGFELSMKPIQQQPAGPPPDVQPHSAERNTP